MISRKLARALPIAVLTLSSGMAFAQAPAPPQRAPAAAPPAAKPSEPDQTTANYGDWVLRCVRTAEGAANARACEIVQALAAQGQQTPVARVAIGSPEKPEKLHLTLMIAPAVSLGQGPQLRLPDKTTPPVVGLAWRRCLPAGCFADVALSPAAIKQLGQQSEPMELTLKDAGDNQVALLISIKGLAQALDALSREGAGSR